MNPVLLVCLIQSFPVWFPIELRSVGRGGGGVWGGGGGDIYRGEGGGGAECFVGWLRWGLAGGSFHG